MGETLQKNLIFEWPVTLRSTSKGGGGWGLPLSNLESWTKLGRPTPPSSYEKRKINVCRKILYENCLQKDNLECKYGYKQEELKNVKVLVKWEINCKWISIRKCPPDLVSYSSVGRSEHYYCFLEGFPRIFQLQCFRIIIA